MATDRILVHASISERFFTAIKAALSSSSGTPSEPPTLVSSVSKTRVENLISGALSDGANIIHGSAVEQLKNSEDVKDAKAKSVRLAPVLLGDVKENMQVWQDEAFASLACCMVVKSDEEAIQVANRGGYGLSAAIFTEDLRRGLRIAREVESG
jgi:acyl-CoA reductase-like NAD-dependent aldehyde dehydrogenase